MKSRYVLWVLVSFAVVNEAILAQPDTAEVREIAEAAYVYGYPVVDLYSILYNYALDPASSEFKAPMNRVGHFRDVASPGDSAVIAPNVDTPYSYAWLDLRAEPVVITVPAFELSRYVSLMLVDAYTWIIGYVTPRTYGNKGGDFLVAGPEWNGEVPPGIRGVFRSTTNIALGLYRTQLINPGDLKNVHALQDQYRVRPLSAYLGTPPPSAAPQFPGLVPPVNLRKQPTSLEFFEVLNWMLDAMPSLPDEANLRGRFSKIGIVPGASFSAGDSLRTAAILRGMQSGLNAIQKRAARVRSSAELFGSREFLKDDYEIRAAGAMLGILGNAAEEYLGIGYAADAEGRPFDGRKSYRIRFAPGRLPPVGAFWSITVYNAERLLYANELRRYVINSPMVSDLEKDDDGGFTLYVQHSSPGPGKEANWLPVPATPFGLTFRTYLPGDAIRTGRWKAPPVTPVPSKNE